LGFAIIYLILITGMEWRIVEDKTCVKVGGRGSENNSVDSGIALDGGSSKPMLNEI
jgi:hypothetical protein